MRADLQPSLRSVRCAGGCPTAFPVGSRRQAQHGIALVVALVLLLIVTILGLAAVRGTRLQQQMASNLYDREMAFQSAEAAMRAGIALVPSNPGLIARNCQAGGVTCLQNPFTDTALPAGSIHDVPAGSAAGQYTAGQLLGSQPQYVVENMGNWADTQSGTGFNQSANSYQYGAQGIVTTAVYYRITARSGDPATSSNRAVVTLQSMVKKG